MKRSFFVHFLLMGILLTTCSDNATNANKDGTNVEWLFDPPSSQPLDAFLMNEKIGRGFNLGNALEAPTEGEWGVVVKDEYLEIIAAAGFNSIRLPVTWPTRTIEEPPFLIAETFLSRVDHIVETALGLDLTVVLNNHHFDALNENPAANRDWLLSIWRQLSEHYKNYPDELFFEILNEPHGAFNDDAQIWHTLAADALRIIREKNPFRMVVIGPISWNSVHYLQGFQLPEDDRGIIATFHYYDPFHFTHQGASWVGEHANDWLGTTWMGSQDERTDVNKAFDAAAAWAQEKNRPLLMGEFGAYNTADMNSRYRWTDYVCRAAEKRGFSWTYWEFGAGFGAYDRDAGQWREILLKALNPDG